MEWIPCEKQLPRVGIRVLLCLTGGRVLIGHRDRPDLVWQVTEKDGRKHWVYDPEAYTDDIDSLPKAEDCGFSQDSDYADGFLSVASVNYDKRFDGVLAWMPLPKPYTADTSQAECRTCKWAETSWTSHYCDDCKAHNKYEPNDTPQTDCGRK